MAEIVKVVAQVERSATHPNHDMTIGSRQAGCAGAYLDHCDDIKKNKTPIGDYALAEAIRLTRKQRSRCRRPAKTLQHSAASAYRCAWWYWTSERCATLS